MLSKLSSNRHLVDGCRENAVRCAAQIFIVRIDLAAWTRNCRHGIARYSSFLVPKSELVFADNWPAAEGGGNGGLMGNF